MFTQKDLRQIRQKGISIDGINTQIGHFRAGFPSADIQMPAIPGRGIICLTEKDERRCRDIFEKHAYGLQLIRFIPASGAATRMFKSLYGALQALEGLSPEKQREWIETKEEIREFFRRLEEYPFYEDLEVPGDASPAEIIDRVLNDRGLGYGNLPKGLLKFHKYNRDDRRTSFEEHIREAAQYCVTGGHQLSVHLTVSPDHLEGFKAEAARIVPAIESETGLTIRVSFSFQKPETDTIAVDPGNEPFRNPDGTLLFRPGGHGALIQNLDALQADILFIGNIDNVAPDRRKETRIRYKKILGGKLFEIRAGIFGFLRDLQKGIVNTDRLEEMLDYLHDHLGMEIPDGIRSLNAAGQRDWLIRTMNRPIRVCGMVKNEGEPGGGPFYVRSGAGDVTLQIVESSQVDLENPEKRELFEQSTHFNPVDLVCSVTDFTGEKFDLTRYVDHRTGFISEKSVGGKNLKALELPGLWNGAMAGWLTLFVEVPLETFSPVKTVFDLLRPEHMASAKEG